MAKRNEETPKQNSFANIRRKMFSDLDMSEIDRAIDGLAAGKLEQKPVESADETETLRAFRMFNQS